MQAIVTKFLPATNFKGSRIKATCERGSITISFDHAKSWDAAHVDAVDALIAKFIKEDAGRYGSERNPWSRPRTCGEIKSGEFVHMFADPENQILIQFDNHDDATAFRNYHASAVETDGTVTGLKCGVMCSALKRSKI